MQEPVERINRTWEFLFAPYLFGANITGTSQVGRLPNTPLDVGFDDILNNMRFAAMARAEALYRQKVGVIVDLSYTNLGNATDTPLTGGRARFDVKQTIIEGLLSYRAFAGQKGSVDVYGGARYWDVSLGLNATGTIAGNFNVSRGDSWVDPVIGLRGFYQMTEKWSVNARGDVGGFGVGSDFTWNVQGGIGYHFNETWSTHVQYKALGVDFDNGRTGTGSFAYDTVTHGPLLGLVARF